MAGENTLGQTNVDAIRDRVNGIQLGPAITENGGRVLDANAMSPEAAGDALNKQAISLLQQGQQQNQALIQQTQQQNQELMRGLTHAIASIGSSQQPVAENPATQYALTQDDMNELGTLHDPVNKATRYAAENAKQEVLAQSQGMINQYSQETNTRIQQLEQKIADNKRINDANFKAQLDGLAHQFGIQMDSLPTDPNWQALINQPVSQFDRTPLRDKITPAVESYDIGFFQTLLRQYADMHGGTSGVTGASDMSQINTAGQMGANNIQYGSLQNAGQATPQAQVPVNSNQAKQAQELQVAYGQIMEQRENLKRQMFQERSITREDFTEQSNALLELEMQLNEKAKTLGIM